MSISSYYIAESDKTTVDLSDDMSIGFVPSDPNYASSRLKMKAGNLLRISEIRVMNLAINKIDQENNIIPDTLDTRKNRPSAIDGLLLMLSNS